MAFPQKLLNDGEHVVVHTRTHPKALVVPFLVLLVSLAVALWVTGRSDSDVLDIAVWVVAALLVLWFSLRPFLDWLTTSYTFTSRRFISRSGLVARKGRTIPLNRISGVDFDIGVVDRAFGCGTLIVTDASAEGRVEVHDIPRVEQVQLQVAEELHRLSEPGPGHPGQPGHPRHPERSDDGA